MSSKTSWTANAYITRRQAGGSSPWPAYTVLAGRARVCYFHLSVHQNTPGNIAILPVQQARNAVQRHQQTRKPQCKDNGLRLQMHHRHSLKHSSCRTAGFSPFPPVPLWPRASAVSSQPWPLRVLLQPPLDHVLVAPEGGVRERDYQSTSRTATHPLLPSQHKPDPDVQRAANYCSLQ